MRKLILPLLCFFCLSYISSSNAGYYYAVSVAAGGDCPTETGETFGWNADHSSGNDYSCDSSQVGADASVNDYDSINDTDNYVEYNLTSEGLCWVIDGGEMDMETDGNEYTIYVSFRLPDTITGQNVLIESYSNPSYFYCRVSSTTEVLCLNSTGSAETATHAGMSANVWYRLGWTFEIGTAGTAPRQKMSIVTEGSAASWDSESTAAMAVWAVTIDDFCINSEALGLTVTEKVQVRYPVVINSYAAADPLP
jgi:hypothetical protein